MQDPDQPLRNELAKLLEEAADRENSWGELARRRRRLHYGIGIPSVVLAGLAGAAALAELSPVLAGVSALTAAVLTGLQTFLQPDASAIRARTQSIGWYEIHTEARILLDLDFASLASGQRRARFDSLQARARALRRGVTNNPAGTEPVR